MVDGGFTHILIFQVILLIATFPLILVSLLLVPRDKNPVKTDAFECGQVPTGEGRVRYIMQYYPYLLLFVVFDVLAMFLYAWALSLRMLSLTTGIIALGFLVILFPPLVFALMLLKKQELW